MSENKDRNLPKNKYNIPRINLSKLITDENHISAEIENIIVQDLIMVDGKIDTVAWYFHVKKEIFERIYLKYFTKITSIISSKNSKQNTDLDLLVDKTTELYGNHIKEIYDFMTTRDDKSLSYNTIRSINSIMDKTIKIQENQIKKYDNQVNKLSDQILKLKDIELKEKGQPNNSNDYLENQQTVFDQLEKLIKDKDDDRI